MIKVPIIINVYVLALIALVYFICTPAPVFAEEVVKKATISKWFKSHVSYSPPTDYIINDILTHDDKASFIVTYNKKTDGNYEKNYMSFYFREIKIKEPELLGLDADNALAIMENRILSESKSRITSRKVNFVGRPAIIYQFTDDRKFTKIYMFIVGKYLTNIAMEARNNKELDAMESSISSFNITE